MDIGRDVERIISCGGCCGWKSGSDAMEGMGFRENMRRKVNVGRLINGAGGGLGS